MCLLPTSKTGRELVFAANQKFLSAFTVLLLLIQCQFVKVVLVGRQQASR